MNDTRIIKINCLEHNGIFLIPTECPICHTPMCPEYLQQFYKRSLDRKEYVVLFFQCKACNEIYAISYQLFKTPDGCYKSNNSQLVTELTSISHQVPLIPPLPKNLLSDNFQRFQDVYSDACTADSLGLKEVAGMGIRKATEFLIKDFLIYRFEKEEDKEKVKNDSMIQCIRKLENQKLLTLAERCAWLGNDETHYVKKHTDHDLQDLKRFFFALIQYIDNEFTLEEALQIERK